MDLTSLQERCLHVIIERLDRFCNVFNTTQDAKLKRYFEFLQRCYTNQILQGLYISDDIVKEEYFPLLINKYLRELNLSILDQVDGETVSRMIAEIGEGLDKITFPGATTFFYPYLPLADIFPHLKNITVLNMQHICDDEVLKNIANFCPHLLDLDIANSQITNDGLRYLCQKNERNEVRNSKLRSLHLWGTNVDYDLPEMVLMSFPQLEVLEAYGMPCALHKMHQNVIHQSTFSDVKKFKLKHLDMVSCRDLPLSPELIKFYSSVCPDVSVLTALITGPDELDALKTFTKLKNVSLVEDIFVPFPEQRVNNFLNYIGSALTVLKLNTFSLSVEELMRNCPLLEELRLTNSLFQLPNVAFVPKELKFLKKFYLGDAFFSDVPTSVSVCAIMLSAPKLEKISISSCAYYTDDFLEAIRYCCINCPLRKVNFRFSQCNPSILQTILLTSRTLKVLRAWYAPLEIEEISRENIELLGNIAFGLDTKPKFDFRILEFS